MLAGQDEFLDFQTKQTLNNVVVRLGKAGFSYSDDALSGAAGLTFASSTTLVTNSDELAEVTAPTIVNAGLIEEQSGLLYLATA